MKEVYQQTLSNELRPWFRQLDVFGDEDLNACDVIASMLDWTYGFTDHHRSKTREWYQLAVSNELRKLSVFEDLNVSDAIASMLDLEQRSPEECLEMLHPRIKETDFWVKLEFYTSEEMEAMHEQDHHVVTTDYDMCGGDFWTGKQFLCNSFYSARCLMFEIFVNRGLFRREASLDENVLTVTDSCFIVIKKAPKVQENLSFT